ncbi:hypothetical protein H0H87_005157, partial [Tephrocybe sp. NHM501043]
MSAQHAQEPTAFSLSETVVERGDSRARPTLNASLTGTTFAATPGAVNSEKTHIDSPPSPTPTTATLTKLPE